VGLGVGDGNKYSAGGPASFFSPKGLFNDRCPGHQWYSRSRVIPCLVLKRNFGFGGNLRTWQGFARDGDIY
jgi:hypothetical protein